MWSNDVELAHGWLLVTAVLVKPLPLGGCRQHSAVLGHAPIWLGGPKVGRVPVFVGDAAAGLVDPGALGYHIVDAQPRLLIWADALADVVAELIVLILGCRCAKDTAQGVAVFAGGVITFPHRVTQETLAIDLFAF